MSIITNSHVLKTMVAPESVEIAILVVKRGIQVVSLAFCTCCNVEALPSVCTVFLSGFYSHHDSNIPCNQDHTRCLFADIPLPFNIGDKSKTFQFQNHSNSSKTNQLSTQFNQRSDKLIWMGGPHSQNPAGVCVAEWCRARLTGASGLEGRNVSDGSDGSDGVKNDNGIGGVLTAGFHYDCLFLR